MSNMRNLIFLGAIVGVMIVSILMILLVKKSPVVIRIPNLNSIREEPILLFLNPFRDKEPEVKAESFLEKLKNGECLKATLSFSDGKSNHICQKQTEYPLEEWKVIDMSKKNEDIWITYKHKSKNVESSEDMIVILDKIERKWQVIDFIIGY